jgi:hypothetical protein
MSHWQPAPNVYAACVRGDLVFLDSRRNRYSCLGRDDAAPVLRLFSGQPVDGAEELLAELQAEGLIEPRAELSREFAIDDVPTAIGDFHDFAAARLPVSPLSLWRLATAGLETALRFAFQTPAAWFARQKGRSEDIAITRACSLALQFDRLRPLLPRSGRCLPKSMVLLAFLRRHGIHAT